MTVPEPEEEIMTAHGVLVERGFSFLSLCRRVVFMVLREFSMRCEEGGVKLFWRPLQ